MDHTQISYRHKTPVQLRFNDIDQLGHVNNAVYQQLFDVARLGYFQDVLEEMPDWLGLSMVLASIRIDYFKPIHLEEQVYIRTKTEMLGDKSLTMVQEIYNLGTGEIKAFNRSVLVGYSAEIRETVSLPVRWRDRITAYEQSLFYKYQAGESFGS